ncbi:host specificity factor TipJ family phage tail protein [Vibrio coralliilyticus]|uniref:host specificity factor TipJ family phage tail protein n=1 Tax=Vibrio coralliilyticus TaxID=190893 RepID=UPI0017A4F5A1|nr:host specificity factor TipJ family phage tail protein [Vibrio coralliilyticus]NUW66965.1 hypothetical protein [Vibrio coralliilyticus]NUW69159.1 hypothetical protein [Vibrio coralliilyticus]
MENVTASHDITLMHLPHPLLTEGRAQYHLAVRPGESLGEVLARLGIPLSGDVPVVVTVNDERVDAWPARGVQPGDLITVRTAVQGHGKLGPILAAIAVLAVAYVAPGVVAATGFDFLATESIGNALLSGVMVAGAAKVAYSLVPPPDATATPSEQQTTPYVLSGTRNAVRLHAPMMLVIGQMRVFPDQATQAYTRFVGEDQVLYQAFHFGLQPTLVLSDLRLGTASVLDFHDVTVHHNDPKGHLPAAYGNVDTLAGAEVKHNTGPVTRSTLPKTQSLELDFQVLAYDTDHEGRAHSKSITVRVDVYAQPPHQAEQRVLTRTYTLSGHGINPVRTTHALTLPQVGTYVVKVTKTSGDVSETQKQRQVQWVALKAFQADDGDYTQQRRLGLTVRASNQLSGTLERVNAIAQAPIPTWDGAKWVTQFTANPAWWLLWWLRGQHDAKGRRVYGAGLADARLDLDAIKAFATWCDRQNLTCNMVVQDATSVRAVANRIARCGRGETTWQSGRYGVVWDDDQLTPVAVFGPANIKAGTVKVDYVSGALADEFVVHFKNAEQDWQPDTVRVTVAGVPHPTQPVSFDFMGCTSASMAGREAALMAAEHVHHRRRVSWQTDAEGLVVAKGDVVLLSHDLLSWSHSGRLLPGGDAFNLFLDTEVPAPEEGQLAVLGLRAPNGHYETYLVSAAEGHQVQLLDGLQGERPGTDETLAHDWLWFYDAGGQSPGRPVKIIEVTVLGPDTFGFTAIDYTPDYYAAESQAVLHFPGYAKTAVSLGAPRPTQIVGLKVVEGRRLDRAGIRHPTAQVSWVPLIGAQSYRFRYRADSTTAWQVVPTTVPPLVLDLPRGHYEGRVRATMSGGQPSAEAALIFDIHDAEWPASGVDHFRATFANNGIVLSWAECLDADYTQTEIRQGATFDTAQVVVQTKGNTALIDWLPAGVHRFWARHWNPNRPSAAPVRTELTVRPPASPRITRSDLQFNTLALGWSDARTDQPIQSYAISMGQAGAPFAKATLYGQAGADSRSDIVLFEAEGRYTVYLEAQDVAGNKGPLASLPVDPTFPNNFTLLRGWDATVATGRVLTNGIALGDGSVLMPFDTSETWQRHFARHHFTTIGDQIRTGAVIYLEPAAGSGTLVQVEDVGKLIRQSLLSVTLEGVQSRGHPVITTRLAWSQDQRTWTEGPANTRRLHARDFRYVRTTMTVTRTTAYQDLLHLQRLKIRLSLEDVTESARLTLHKSGKGDAYTPHKPFYDIVSVMATPLNSPHIATINAVIDDAGPVPRVIVQAWDRANRRVDGTVSLLIGGV